MRALKVIGAVLVSIPVLVCLLTGAIVLGSAAGAIYAISRPQESKVVLTIPMTDDRGRDRPIVITLSGKQDAALDPLSAVGQSATGGLASGELQGNLAVYVGPFDWKLVETQVRIRVPLEEMLHDAIQAAMRSATSGIAVPTPPPSWLGPTATPTPRR